MFFVRSYFFPQINFLPFFFPSCEFFSRIFIKVAEEEKIIVRVSGVGGECYDSGKKNVRSAH